MEEEKKKIEKERILMESFFCSFLQFVIVKASLVDHISMLKHSFFELSIQKLMDYLKNVVQGEDQQV